MNERLHIPDAEQGGHLEAVPNGGIRAGEHLQVTLRLRSGSGHSMDLDRSEVLALCDYLDAWLLDTMPEPTGPTCEAAEQSILQEAQSAIYGDREADYGSPRDNWTRTAILWTGLLQHKLADGEYITPEDGLRCMVAVKLARDVHSPKRDNRVDGAGYLALLDRLETGK